MPLGLMVIDGEGRLVRINEVLLGILGYSREELGEEDWGAALFGDEKNIAFNQVLIDVINQESVNLKKTVTYRNAKTDREYILSVTSSFLRLDGSAKGVVVLIEDATSDYRRLERERRLLEEKTAVERERTTSLKNFSLSVAHQIRNPITAIAGFARLLSRSLQPGSPDFERCESIRQEAVKLEALVKAVASYASLTPAARELTAARPFLENVVNAFVARMAAGGREVRVGLDCEDGTLFIDREHMARALGHLLRNAFDFSDSDFAVLEARREPAGMLITLRDEGRGCAVEDLPFVFDPFFTTKASGVGMGLTEVKRIIFEHQGEISFESPPGSGAVVYLRLPGVERRAPGV